MKAVGRRTSDLEAIITTGDLNALRRALMAGADPDRLGQHGWSPAWEAIRRGRADQLGLLLAYGAALAPEGLPEGTLLHVAAFWGAPACIDALLAAGADVLAVDATGETALCHAVRAANVDNVRRLLDAQAVVMPRPDTPEGSVPTLLASAVDRGDARLVALLLDAGAEPDWYGYYTWGDTPLIAAAREGHREICALLLAAGADPDIHLWTGETAADVTTDPVIRDLLAAVKA
jgi:ankyrin repeat protein